MDIHGVGNGWFLCFICTWFLLPTPWYMSERSFYISTPTSALFFLMAAWWPQYDCTVVSLVIPLWMDGKLGKLAYLFMYTVLSVPKPLCNWAEIMNNADCWWLWKAHCCQGQTLGFKELFSFNPHNPLGWSWPYTPLHGKLRQERVTACLMSPNSQGRTIVTSRSVWLSGPQS